MKRAFSDLHGLAARFNIAWAKRAMFAGLFAVGLWGGAFSGRLFVEGRRDYEELTSVQPTVELVSLEVQHTLIVLVDDASQPMAQILGIWQASHQSGKQVFYLNAVYPVAAGSPLDLYREAHSPQLVNTADLSSLQQVPVLQAQGNVSWDAVIVLDREALATLIDNAANTSASGTGAVWVGDLPNSWEQPAAAGSELAKMLHFIVENVKAHSANLSAPQLAEALLSSGHVLSDRSLPELKLNAEGVNLAELQVSLPEAPAPTE